MTCQYTDIHPKTSKHPYLSIFISYLHTCTDPAVFIDLVLPIQVSPKAFQRSNQSQSSGAVAGTRTQGGGTGVADAISNMTLNVGDETTGSNNNNNNNNNSNNSNKVDDYGKANVGKGPLQRVLEKDQKAIALPQRFISRRSRTAFTAPKGFDSSRHGDAGES